MTIGDGTRRLPLTSEGMAETYSELSMVPALPCDYDPRSPGALQAPVTVQAIPLLFSMGPFSLMSQRMDKRIRK